MYCFTSVTIKLTNTIILIMFSTKEALTNFVWETVDPSRQGETQFQDTMAQVLGSLSAAMMAPERVYEDCDCDTDPSCICNDVDDDEEEEEEEEEEEKEEEEEDREDEEELEQDTEEKEEADKETEIDKDVENEEDNLFDLEDESEIIYRQKMLMWGERIRVLEDLLAEEQEPASRAVLEHQVAKIRREREAVYRMEGEEVLGTEALEVLKTQLDARDKAKDEL